MTTENKNVFTAGERRLLDWQHGRGGGFTSALFKALSVADIGNFRRLGEGFPDEAEAFMRFRDEPGYWERLNRRWEAGDR